MARDRREPFWADDPVGREIKTQSIRRNIEMAARDSMRLGMANTPFIQLCQYVWHEVEGTPFGVILDKEVRE